MNYLNKAIWAAFASFLIIHTVEAATPLWTFTPLTPVKITVPANSSATIRYAVTNQSPKKIHTLIMTPIPGITQEISGGNCPNPFVLAPHQSCILSLQVTGSALQGNIKGGPVVCQNGNPLQCYQPSAENSLDITRVDSTATTITSSINNLALSVYDATNNPQLTGTPRKITITNTGTTPATNVTWNIAPALPAGSSITPSSCGNIAPGNTCILTVTPGSTPSSPVADLSPTPLTLTIQGSNTNTLAPMVEILTYGSVYQGGYVFFVDDATPDTVSIDGKVAGLEDQGSIIWSSNGDGGAGNDVDYTNIPGIYLDSTIPCNGSNAGACNSGVIIDYYNANRASGGSPPTPLNYYAAGLCSLDTNGGFNDWYLPAICELGPNSNGSGCAQGLNIQDNLPFLLSAGCVGSGCLSGLYWSSTEDAVLPQFGAWTESFSSGGTSFQVVGGKGQLLSVRCVRIF